MRQEPQPPRISVVVAEDDPLAQRAIAAYLARATDIEIVGVAANGKAALALIREHAPDVLLTDLYMPGMDGFELIEQALTLEDPPRTLCLTALGDESTMRSALAAGASGLLLKVDPPELLIQAIRITYNGDAMVSPKLLASVLRTFARRGQAPPDLSQTELELVRLVGSGLDNDAIGRRLSFTPSTIKTYLSRLLRKTGCRNRAQLAVRAHEWGLAG